jgi:apolipoprotein N-acyltransferase
MKNLNNPGIAAAPAPPLLALGAAILSGLLLAAAFPKWDQTYLLPVALVPLFWALRGQSWKAALGLGLVSGLAFYLGLLYWIVYVTYVFGGLPLPLCLVVLLLLAGYLSLYRLGWALGVNWAQGRGISPLWFAPALWVALELGQTYIISGFPWELLGTGLYRSPLLLQVADLTGVYGLSFLVVLVNAALYLLLFPPPGKPRPLRPLAVVGLILLAWVGYGYFRLGAMAKLAAQSPKLQVAVVQGNIKQGEKWKKEMVMATLARYGELTQKVKGARLIIWPETAAPFFFLRTPGLTDQVQDIARASQGYLLFGAPAWELTTQGESYYNRAYLLSPQGEVSGYYDKAHLVPYGEYVPLKRYFPFLGKMTLMVGDLAEGPVGGVVSLPEGAVGPLVCFESIFPELSRAQVQNGARLLVNLTNDAWYGTTSAPYQSLAMAVLRAVETHVCMARAANTGISAFIGGDGRILWESGLFVPEAKSLELPWLPGGSLYTRIGDAFAWACTVLAGLTLIIGRRRLRG